MSGRRWRRWLWFALLVAGIIAVAAFTSSPSSKAGTGSTQTTRSGPARAYLYANVGDGSENGSPLVQVTIGGGDPIWAVLDSGSTGLRVMTSAADNDIIETSTVQESATFADGTEVDGPVGQAFVEVAGVATTRPVPIEVINTISCQLVGQQFCGTANLLGPPDQGPGADGVQVQGILGIGQFPDPQGTLTNPLESLPKPYSLSWSIAMGQAADPPLGYQGALTLGSGAPAPSSLTLEPPGASVTTSPLRNYSGPSLCWTVAGVWSCGRTLVDSGASYCLIGGPSLSSLTMDPDGTFLAPMQKVSVSLPGRPPFWSFSTGTLAGFNLVAAYPASQFTAVLGISLFYQYTVTFDADGGILLST